MAATITRTRDSAPSLSHKVGSSSRSCLCLLVALSFLATLDVASAALPYVNPDDPNEIIWGSLPPIPEVTNQSSSTSRPGTLAMMAEGFVDLVQPQGLPFDYITFALQNTVYNQTTYYEDNWQSEIWKIMGLIVGIIVCVLFGVLYCIIVPPTGFFFGCCRCCNNCGGKRVQRESKLMGCKRVTLSLLFFSITGVICAWMAFTNVSNEFMQDSVDEFKVIADSSLGNLESYLNGANEQLDYIINTEYSFVDQLLRDNLENIGEKIGVPIEDYLLTEAGLQDVISGVNNISRTLTEMEAALVDISSLQESLVNDASTLETELSGVRTSLNDVNAECSDCVPNVDQLRVIADFTQLPSLDPQVEGVQEATEVAVNITLEIDSVLNEIPAQIANMSQDSVQEALQQLDDASNEVNSSFSEISNTIADFASQLSGAKDDLNGIWDDTVKVYAQYVYYGLIGLTCTVLLIVMFNLIGMTMGTFSYKNVLPTERSRMSNAGGNVLMAGVFFTFVFAPLLMFLTCLMFAGLSGLTLLCEPLLTYQAFNETIDQPNVIVEGYYLGEALLGNSSIPLTVTGIFTQCDKDASAYTAFMLESLYDLDSFKQQLDELQAEVDRLISDIDPNDLEYDIPFSDFIGDLGQLVNMTELANINYTLYSEVLSLSITAVNLTEYAVNLTEIAQSNPGVAGNLTAQEAALMMIQADIVDPMQANMNQIQNDLDLIQSLERTLNAQIDATAAAVNVTEVSISSNETSDAIINITQEYANRLVDYADQLYNQINNQVQEDFARCKLVSSVYAYSVQSSCDYPISSLNTLWFTVGWCVFFYVPSIIFAVKLAKYYRIMDEEAPYRAPKSKSKKKKKKKGKENGRRDSEEEMALDDMDTGPDNIRLVDNGRPPSMMAQQNPHYVPDEPIMAYNDLGRPMAPPPAYNPAYPKGAPPTLPPIDSTFNPYSRAYYGDVQQPMSEQLYETPFDGNNLSPTSGPGPSYGQHPVPATRQSINMYPYNPQYDRAF